MKWSALFLSLSITLLPLGVIAQQSNITLEHESTVSVSHSGRLDLDNDVKLYCFLI